MKNTHVPYFCQWESPEWAEDIVLGRRAAKDDPLWPQSGATTQEEYALWAYHMCGMACLKMVLAQRQNKIIPLVHLARQATCYGGYIIKKDEVKGLIYAPFVAFVREIFGLDSHIEVGKNAKDIPALLQEGSFFIASVHPFIRWPERTPPQKGGHLVLVTAANNHEITFHNPSGHTSQAQENAKLPLDTFDRFFAGRGILIRKEEKEKA
ncbi:MAG TPA: hypothetical protein DD400_04640 [Rhodospirillaceae bacterium]|nr:hypothetical protein [Rhodospirillaceae bacterium]